MATAQILKLEDRGQVTIPAPNMKRVTLVLIGTAPYVQLRMTEKALRQMRDNMELGDKAKKNRKKEPRDYEKEYRAATYRAKEGWYGIPASAFRNAAISACRVAGFAMTKAKLSIFIEADGMDELNGTPLVRIIGNPEKYEAPVRNATGVADIRVRAMWREWSVKLTVRYDGDQFSETDVVNLLMRVGIQVGVGEGRPDSKDSCGLGFGLFDIQEK